MDNDKDLISHVNESEKVLKEYKRIIELTAFSLLSNTGMDTEVINL